MLGGNGREEEQEDEVKREAKGEKYRVAQHVSDLGWVDIDFGCSTACLILLGLVRDGQNWQISWAR